MLFQSDHLTDINTHTHMFSETNMKCISVYVMTFAPFFRLSLVKMNKTWKKQENKQKKEAVTQQRGGGK